MESADNQFSPYRPIDVLGPKTYLDYCECVICRSLRDDLGRSCRSCGIHHVIRATERRNCVQTPPGHGLCDMCTRGRYDLCRFVNTQGAMNEIDTLTKENEKMKRSLESAGYTDEGGEHWKPPVSNSRWFKELWLRKEALVKELKEATELRDAYKLVIDNLSRELQKMSSQLNSAKWDGSWK